MNDPRPSGAVLAARLANQARVKHLQLIVRVAELGTIQKAAEAVGMSQPAATHALAGIETLLGLALFERHARGMRPGAAGQVLLPLVRRALDAVQQLADATAAVQAGAAGVVHVAALSAGASGVLGRALPGFSAAHPDIQVEVREVDQDRLLRTLLGQRAADLFLCRGGTALPPGYRYTELEADRCVVTARPDHPLAARATLAPQDCAGETWFVPPPGVPTRQHFDAWCARAGFRPRLCPVSTLSATVAWGMMDGAAMLGVVSWHFIRPYVEAGHLVCLPLAIPGAMPAIGLVQPDSGAGRAAELLAAHLLRTCRPAN